MAKRDIAKKVLLLLAAGVALSLNRSPRGYFKILHGVQQAWHDIEKQKLLRLAREFRHGRLVAFKENYDNTVNITLTEDGEKKALRYKIDELRITPPNTWDRKWRLVTFDIPDKKKNAREAMRQKLKELGFYRLQKSVFIYPYECTNEINFINEVFEIRPYVTLVEATKITNEAALKLKFKLR